MREGWMYQKSGFGECRSRPQNATARRREELGLLITKSFEDSGGAYGYGGWRRS